MKDSGTSADYVDIVMSFSMQVPQHLFANYKRIQLEIYRNRFIYPRISSANILVRSSSKIYLICEWLIQVLP